MVSINLFEYGLRRSTTYGYELWEILCLEGFLVIYDSDETLD